MISDSEPWRNHLLADVRGLAKRAKTKRITEQRAAFVERAVFFGVYVMRKLDDSKKLSTAWRGTALKCARFAPMGRRPSLTDWHHIDRHYDLSKPRPETMSARDFCDLVIHSFIFIELLADDRSINGFFITSDRLKTKGLWLFGLDTVVDLMEQTAEDSPAVGHMLRNPETGEIEVWAGNGEPPEDWKGKAKKFTQQWHSKALPK